MSPVFPDKDEQLLIYLAGKRPVITEQVMLDNIAALTDEGVIRLVNAKALKDTQRIVNIKLEVLKDFTVTIDIDGHLTVDLSKGTINWGVLGVADTTKLQIYIDENSIPYRPIFHNPDEDMSYTDDDE